jgi:hypothetical protein
VIVNNPRKTNYRRVSEDVDLAAVWFPKCNLPAPNDIQRSRSIEVKYRFSG